MIPTPEQVTSLNERRRIDEAKKQAIARASKRCPVIKAINKALDDQKIYDIEHGLDVAMYAAGALPEGMATVVLLKRLKGFSCGE